MPTTPCLCICSRSCCCLTRDGASVARSGRIATAESLLDQASSVGGEDHPVSLRKVQGGAVKARINGSWTGWSGNTIVKLTNGSVWEQAEYYYDCLLYTSDAADD